MQSCSRAVRQACSSAILRFCGSAVLQFCGFAVLPLKGAKKSIRITMGYPKFLTQSPREGLPPTSEQITLQEIAKKFTQRTQSFLFSAL